MSEQKIAVGQTWRSYGARRVVKVTRYIDEWDDCRVQNVQTGRHHDVFGAFLRSHYELIEDAACRSERIAVRDEEEA